MRLKHLPRYGADQPEGVAVRAAVGRPWRLLLLTVGLFSRHVQTLDKDIDLLHSGVRREPANSALAVDGAARRHTKASGVAVVSRALSAAARAVRCAVRAMPSTSLFPVGVVSVSGSSSGGGTPPAVAAGVAVGASVAGDAAVAVAVAAAVAVAVEAEAAAVM